MNYACPVCDCFIPTCHWRWQIMVLSVFCISACAIMSVHPGPDTWLRSETLLLMSLVLCFNLQEVLQVMLSSALKELVCWWNTSGPPSRSAHNHCFPDCGSELVWVLTMVKHHFPCLPPLNHASFLEFSVPLRFSNQWPVCVLTAARAVVPALLSQWQYSAMSKVFLVVSNIYRCIRNYPKT